jgi:predicted dehydrogenase
MRAIPHWMPWQERQGWVTLRIMSIHHLDTFRYWFGNPDRIMASVTQDPRTLQKFPHQDGIALYILEYDSGTRASSWDDVWAGPAREGAGEAIGINWRVEGTAGMATGTIGWPRYPEQSPSTLRFTRTIDQGQWHQPTWNEAWFPDAFIGPMADLLCALDADQQPMCSGRENLWTMALVDAAYRSAQEHRSVAPAEIFKSNGVNLPASTSRSTTDN